MTKSKRIRACLFDMDGTLINSEDLYTECASEMLAEYGKGPLSWDVKIKLQGRPALEATKILVEEYELPITAEEFSAKAMKKQELIWHKTKFLPGALELLKYLELKSIPIALGTSSNSINFERKTRHLKEFSVFRHHVVTGDDKRIPKDRGKPHPDIWHVCLESINNERKDRGLVPIKMDECLIFEDGIPGVYSGIAANSFVIWIPHANALRILNGKEEDIIGARGEILRSLLDFDKTKYSL